MANLETRKIAKILLTQCLLTEFRDHSLVYAPCCVPVPVLYFVLCHLQICLQLRIGFKISVKDFLGIFCFSQSLLKLDVGEPSFFARKPVHPPLKDVSGLGILTNDLFHVGILKPKLVFSRQIVYCSLPNVSSMVDEFMFHLHLGVTQPQTLVRVFDF